MVEKFKAIRDAYKEEERALEEKLAKVRIRIDMFDEMIAEEEGLATVTEEKPSETIVAIEENHDVVEEKKEDSEIIEIRL